MLKDYSDEDTDDLQVSCVTRADIEYQIWIPCVIIWINISILVLIDMSDETQLFDPIDTRFHKSVKSVKVTRINRTVNKFTIDTLFCVLLMY